MSLRLVIDSSVVVTAMRPSEPGHADALDFFARLADAQARGDVEVLAPPELWLEVHVATRRAQGARDVAPLADPTRELAIATVPLADAASIHDFLAELDARTRHKVPYTNATDLVYLWVAWQAGAALVTLDRALLKYHGAVCDVMRPFHVHFPRVTRGAAPPCDEAGAAGEEGS